MISSIPLYWFGFGGTGTILVYKCQIHFYTYKQFFFKRQFRIRIDFHLNTVKCQGCFISNNQFRIYSLVLFDSQRGAYQVLPFQARVDLGAMAMKGCSIFPKVLA